MSRNSETGLAFGDLAAWRAHERRRRRVVSTVRQLRSRREDDGPSAVLHGPAQPTTLVVIDHISASCRFAVEAPLRHLNASTTAVLAVPGWTPSLEHGSGTSESRVWTGALPDSIRTVLTLGAFNPLAAQVTPWALDRGIPVFVAQHGLLTRWAPPLVPGERVLGWTADDVRYWNGGRDVLGSRVVGSQMLWEAGRSEPSRPDDDRPVILGQLHGTEMSRPALLRSYVMFARETGAQYRPHPNETDAVSRTLHRAMRAAGVSFSTSSVPVAELRRPVVSVFSTGTLEAAHRGLPAWVTHTDPPAWVREVWQRYGLAPWGTPATQPLAQPPSEPALAIAQHLDAMAAA